MNRLLKTNCKRVRLQRLMRYAQATVHRIYQHACGKSRKEMNARHAPGRFQLSALCCSRPHSGGRVAGVFYKMMRVLFLHSDVKKQHVVVFRPKGAFDHSPYFLVNIGGNPLLAKLLTSILQHETVIQVRRSLAHEGLA